MTLPTRTLLLLAALLLPVASAQAAVRARSVEVEAFWGRTELSGARRAIDDSRDAIAGSVQGLRAGWMASPHVGFCLSYGTFSDSLTRATFAGPRSVKLHERLADASVEYHFKPHEMTVWVARGGAGWSGVSPGGGDTATAHAAFGVKLALTERLYLRPDLLARWYVQDDQHLHGGSHVDWEATVGIGFTFGARTDKSLGLPPPPRS